MAILFQVVTCCDDCTILSAELIFIKPICFFYLIGHSLNWSRGISLSSMTPAPSDQYVRLPLHGDVKLIMYTRCYTTYINILPISQVSRYDNDLKKSWKIISMKKNNSDLQNIWVY